MSPIPGYGEVHDKELKKMGKNELLDEVLHLRTHFTRIHRDLEETASECARLSSANTALKNEKIVLEERARLWKETAMETATEYVNSEASYSAEKRWAREVQDANG